MTAIHEQLVRDHVDRLIRDAQRPRRRTRRRRFGRRR